VRELARRGLGRHVRELEPDRLEVGDPAVLLALEAVARRRAPPARYRCLGRDPDAPAVEGRHGRDKPFRSRRAVAVHDGAVERRSAVDDEWASLLLGHLDVIGVEQGRYAVRPRFRSVLAKTRNIDVAAVRAPLLRSVDPPAAAVHRPSSWRAGVRPTPLGERERPDDLTAREGRHEPLLLLVGAEGHDRRVAALVCTATVTPTPASARDSSSRTRT
jgi:hypothetical protein